MNDDIFRPGDDASSGLTDNSTIDSPVTPDDSAKNSTPDFPDVLPVLPVRDIVLFNYMILPLHVGREASVKAVDAALNGSRYLFVLTQKEEGVDEPGPGDLYTTGTVVMVMRMLKMPDNRLKLLVQGVSRAKANAFVEREGYLEASITPLVEPEEYPLSVKVEAMMRAAREQCEKILAMRGMASPEIVTVLSGLDHPGRLADLIASNLRLKIEDAQAILECLDPVERLSMVNKHLSKEVEVTNIQAKIQE
ncbi:MAG: LON peptidase substrate-binding domain-containing protein, partial [Deltaproteobacteria bacterium]|nr:LON peptidase substrate-binding domain-containing protein [Deltaproteobacteria bacterium]